VSHGKIYVAGHNGLVGRAIHKALQEQTESKIIVQNRNQLDLTNEKAVDAYLAFERPDTVVIAAALVGGIAANIARPVDFLTKNLAIQNNLMMGAVKHGASTIMMLGSSCIYPRMAAQPISENAFMTGPLEPTNESYAVAKIAGIRLAQSLHQEMGIRVILPMPCNVYGPGDHFDLNRAHVASALVKRFVDACQEGQKSIELWGTGQAKREFIHSTDLANACLFLLNSWDSDQIINVGSGTDVTIMQLAETVAQIVGFEGEINWDHSKPDGMPRKLLDISRIQELGWSPMTELKTGLTSLVHEYRQSLA
jgi:GDP-L-fucose synthase